MSIKAFAPSTISNMSLGSKILAITMNDLGDEVLIKDGTSEGIRINKIIKGRNHSKDIKRNPVGIATSLLMSHLGLTDRAIEIDIFLKSASPDIPESKVASTVASLLALNKHLKSGLSKQQLLPFAISAMQSLYGSGLGSHIVASMMGGIILLRDENGIDYSKLYIPTGLIYVVILPADQDEILDSSMSDQNSGLQSANLSTLVVALYTGDFDKISRCFNASNSKYLSQGIPTKYQTMHKIALSAGALGFSHCNQGSAMIAICNNSLIAETIEYKAKRLFENCRVYASTINQEGAVIC